MNLQARIMNLSDSLPGVEPSRGYKVGHRDARHAAAEIAAEGDALVEDLAAKLRDVCEWLESAPGGLGESAQVSLKNARAALAKARP